MNMIASVPVHMPKTPIIVYNLGLNSINKLKLSSYYNVEVKDFSFDKYPEHVKSLGIYAWKSLIINEMQQLNLPIILRCDASCQLQCPIES